VPGKKAAEEYQISGIHVPKMKRDLLGRGARVKETKEGESKGTWASRTFSPNKPARKRTIK